MLNYSTNREDQTGTKLLPYLSACIFFVKNRSGSWVNNDLDWSQIERHDLPQTNNAAPQNTGGSSENSQPNSYTSQNTPTDGSTSHGMQDGSRVRLLYQRDNTQMENHQTDGSRRIYNPPSCSGSGQGEGLRYPGGQTVPYTMHSSYPPAYNPRNGVHNGHHNDVPNTRTDRVLPSEEPPSYTEVMSQHNR